MDILLFVTRNATQCLIILPAWLILTQLATCVQWSRLARSTGGSAGPSKPVPARRISRFVSFDKSHRKEQGLFVYQDPDSGLALQLPLIGSSQLGKGTSDYLAFPHSPGIFDWPVAKYLPIMQPELIRR